MAKSFSQILEKGVVDLRTRHRTDAETSFGDQLKDLRRRLDLTQDEFAERYAVPVGNIRNWEQVSRGTQPDAMARLVIQMIAADPDGAAELVREVKEAEEKRRKAWFRRRG